MEELDPAVVRVWRVLGGLPGALLTLITLPIILASGAHPIALAGLAVALVVLVVGGGVLPGVRYRHLRWGVTDGVLLLRDGVFWRREAAVPTFRIQHVDLEQGPLERWAGVQKLVVRTASADADITVPGLTAAAAPEVRTRLIALSRAAVERYGVGEASDAV